MAGVGSENSGHGQQVGGRKAAGDMGVNHMCDTNTGVCMQAWVWMGVGMAVHGLHSQALKPVLYMPQGPGQ